MALPLIILSHQKALFLQQHDSSQDKFEHGFLTPFAAMLQDKFACFCCCFNNVASTKDIPPVKVLVETLETIATNHYFSTNHGRKI